MKRPYFLSFFSKESGKWAILSFPRNNTVGAGNSISERIAHIISLGAVAVYAQALKIPFAVTTTPALRNNMINIYIPFTEASPTADTAIPSIVPRIFRKVCVTIICHNKPTLSHLHFWCFRTQRALFEGYYKSL